MQLLVWAFDSLSGDVPVKEIAPSLERTKDRHELPPTTSPSHLEPFTASKYRLIKCTELSARGDCGVA